jgi:MFS superfamily sulfate permease-like transporter
MFNLKNSGILHDLRAGVSVAGLLLPSAIAYAAIAGLSPDHAIVATVVGLLVYAFAGGSRFAMVAPTSSSAAILAVSLVGMQDTPGLREAASYAAVLITGLFFLAGGLGRLGEMASFLSRPVLRGFTFGIGILISLRQFPAIFGVPVAASEPWSMLAGLITQARDWNWASLSLGLTALVVLLWMRRYRAVPGAVLVLAVGIAIGEWGNPGLWHMALVGQIALPALQVGLPALSMAQWISMARFGLPLVMILFAESWTSIRGLALLHGDKVHANRELFALGAANLAVGLVHGMPVGAGFSASSAGEVAGARSRLAGVLAALTILAVVLGGRGLIAHLPQSILGVVVISALFHALDPTPLLRLWRMRRDEWVASAAVLAVVGFGVLNGMLVAVALSILALLRRLSGSRVAELGRLAGSHDFVDILRNPQAVSDPAILVLRPAEPLFFANAERVLAEVMTRAAAPKLRKIIISVEESSDLDSTALEALLECDQRLTATGRLLLLARAKDDVRDGLRRAGGEALAGEDRCFWSVADAFTAASYQRP